MAIIAELTDVGEQLRAQHLIDGVSYQITKIKAGSGHVATAALARARTDIVTPFVPARENDSPQGIALANDPVAQVRYIDAASVTYDIKEFGAFAGTQMTHYICDDGGATLYPKTPTLTLDVGLYIAVASGDQAAFTFGDEIKAPLATELVPGLVRLSQLGFDIHDDVTTEDDTIGDTDRFVRSSEGDAGDPMEYVEAQDLAKYVWDKYVSVSTSAPQSSDATGKPDKHVWIQRES